MVAELTTLPLSYSTCEPLQPKRIAAVFQHGSMPLRPNPA
jgi:hypothetical protein